MGRERGEGEIERDRGRERERGGRERQGDRDRPRTGLFAFCLLLLLLLLPSFLPNDGASLEDTCAAAAAPPQMPQLSFPAQAIFLGGAQQKKGSGKTASSIN